MAIRFCLTASFAAALLFLSLPQPEAAACCPAPPRGKPVVNADQTIILIWDAARKTQHFIRKASFKSDADDFGFLVPTPSAPELQESGNDAFAFLQKLTEPEVRKMARPSPGIGCGCSSKTAAPPTKPAVRVLNEKLVAGFNAVVLEADTAGDLAAWLKKNGYASSPEIEAWAKPYVDGGWKITAMQVAKDQDGKPSKDVAASALRMTFQTDKPLFPYREPDPKNFAQALGAKERLLRIYFISDARYDGGLTKEVPWTGKVAWAGTLKPEDRKRVLELLKLPESTGPAEWWLTEFEDAWPYRAAPADVYFTRSADQSPVRREPAYQYTYSAWPGDVTVYGLAAALLLPLAWRRLKK